jgi:hypothetical protein
MEQHKGKIDGAAAQKFLGDHFDSFAGKVDFNERTLCGHIETSPRGQGTWQPPYGPAGAVQNKVADAAGAEKMSLTALLGHACGRNFKAAEHLARHPEFAWQKDTLHDMKFAGLDEVRGEVTRRATSLAALGGRGPAHVFGARGY